MFDLLNGRPVKLIQLLLTLGHTTHTHTPTMCVCMVTYTCIHHPHTHCFVCVHGVCARCMLAYVCIHHAHICILCVCACYVYCVCMHSLCQRIYRYSVRVCIEYMKPNTPHTQFSMYVKPFQFQFQAISVSKHTLLTTDTAAIAVSNCLVYCLVYALV